VEGRRQRGRAKGERAAPGALAVSACSGGRIFDGRSGCNDRTSTARPHTRACARSGGRGDRADPGDDRARSPVQQAKERGLTSTVVLCARRAEQGGCAGRGELDREVDSGDAAGRQSWQASADGIIRDHPGSRPRPRPNEPSRPRVPQSRNLLTASLLPWTPRPCSWTVSFSSPVLVMSAPCPSLSATGAYGSLPRLTALLDGAYDDAGRKSPASPASFSDTGASPQTCIADSWTATEGAHVLGRICTVACHCIAGAPKVTLTRRQLRRLVLVARCAFSRKKPDIHQRFLIDRSSWLTVHSYYSAFLRGILGSLYALTIF
jgi:hypothetical protein